MKKLIGQGNITLGQLAAMCNATVIGNPDTVVSGLCTDSREAGPGICFLAIRGAKSDGHAYIGQVAAAGAACALCEEIPAVLPDMPVAVAENTVDALGRLASAYAAKSGALRIGVTGSVGKTTTKEFISAALSSRRVYKSQGNSNSIIGMPMSLTEMNGDAEFAVFECGMERKGEMPRISRVCRPDIAVITNIGSSHLEYFDNREVLSRWKLTVANDMNPRGTLLLSAEEPLFAQRISLDPRVKTFSADGKTDADFMLKNVRRSGGGELFDVAARGREIKDLAIPVTGSHNLAAALIGTAVAVIAGLSDDEIRRGLATYTPVAMRQQILNIGGVKVIADCYNASPESMRAAAELLCDPDNGGRKIAVLGDMYELGEQSERMHFDTGRYFAEKGTDVLVAFGPAAGIIADGAETLTGRENVYRFADISDASAPAGKLFELAKPGDTVLVKASRGVAAERIIEEFTKLTENS